MKTKVLYRIGYYNTHMVKNVSKITPLELDIIALYCDDYNKGIHIREIARRLGMNHRSIMLTLQRLEKKSIMQAKTIGKNKVHSLNLHNIITREYITSAEINRTISLLNRKFIFKKLAQEIISEMGHLPIILFGSYARRNETKESDIDILIFTDQGDYNGEVEKKIKDFGKTYGVRFQIQKGTRDSFEKGLLEKDPLVIEIAQNHVILNNYQFFIGVLWRFAYGK